MPKRNVRVDIPIGSPDAMIKLVDKIFTRHVELGDDSGLNDPQIDMDAFETVHELHKEKREEGTGNHELAEPLIQAADTALGTEEGQTIETPGTVYNLSGRIRDRLLIVHNDKDEEELTTYGYNVVVNESGGKRTVSVEIPIESPDKMIKLAKKILKRHVALGPASPLIIPEIDMDAFETVAELHEEKREEGNDKHGKGEAAIQKADKALGTEEGQNIDTKGTVYNFTGDGRDILLFKNPVEEEELTTYGFNVVISMTPLPGEEEPEVVTGNVNATETVGVTDTITDESAITLKNTGTVELIFCRAADAITVCDPAAGTAVAAGGETEITGAALGASGVWLNVTNNDASDAGAFAVVIE